MTATWMWHLVSRMIDGRRRGGALTAGRVLGLSVGFAGVLAGMVSCDRYRASVPGSGSAAGIAAEITVGSLACSDTAAVRTLSAKGVPIQCPLLVVSVDSAGDSVRLIGPADREYRLPRSALKRFGQARIPEGLAGATDSLIERMAPGPNPGVLTTQTTFGLLFRNVSGGLDTVFPGDLPALQETMGGTGLDLEACLDSLEASPAYGLLSAPFAPDLVCGIGSARIWKYTGDSLVEAGPGSDAGKPWKSAFSLAALSKPGPSGASGGISAASATNGRNWIFLLTSENYVVWRTAGGRARILEASFMENSELESIGAAEVDGDSMHELFLEVKTHEGDGFYTTLYVLKGGPIGQADDAPRLGSIGLAGSNAEADGSTVESDWWIRSPYIYHAYAQVANPGGRGISHDTRLDAYDFSDAKGFTRTSHPFSAAVYFGEPGSRWKSELFCDSLSARQPEAARAGLRPLPRRTSEGISWQPGALAPDLATAERWAGWHPSGKAAALEIRAIQGR